MYRRLFVAGPWKQIVENGKKILVGSYDKPKYNIYKLKDMDKDCVTLSIKESWPCQACIQVPDGKVQKITDLLQKDGYSVALDDTVMYLIKNEKFDLKKVIY